MRILILNPHGGIVGGTETYLWRLIPALRSLQHQVAFLYEYESPETTNVATQGIQIWCVERLGLQESVEEASRWRPDIIFAHGLPAEDLEEKILKLAPSAYFIHNYFGVCISGVKAHQIPVIEPCHKRLGWPCLLHYLPRRCGGLSPLTMWTEYRKQLRRLANFSRYNLLITHSEAMRQEYLKHGLPEEKVHVVPMGLDTGVAPDANLNRKAPSETVNLLFVGRMEKLKGGTYLLEAVQKLPKLLQKPVRLTFAGDGQERRKWEEKGRRIQAESAEIQVHFTGWIGRDRLSSLFSETDLLVVPSLWPEPFGLVGLEAARYGVPAVAFDVGGVTAWLEDGVNGCLAPGDPPTPAGLVAGMHRALRDPDQYQRLRLGAVERTKRIGIEDHARALEALFARMQSVAVSGRVV